MTFPRPHSYLEKKWSWCCGLLNNCEPCFSRRTFYRPRNWGGVGWGGLKTFNGTSTHIWCYATQSSLLQDTMFLHYAFVITARHDMMLRDAVGWGGVGWGGLITFNGTSTHIWCYATQSSLLQDMIWCYATHSSLVQDMIWCYATQWGGVGWGGVGWGGVG